MKKLITILIIFSALFVNAQDYYVTPTGDDANEGSLAKPFKTVAKAMEMAEGNSAGKSIWLDEGLYNIESGMTFTSAHNGITIRAMEGKNVILSGGKAVGGHLFKILSNADELKRLPEVARGKVYVADLPDELAGTFPPKNRYDKMGAISWNGYRLNIAQYPNKGFGYMGDVLYPGPTDKNLAYSEANPIGGEFKIQDDLDWIALADEFARTKDMLIHGYINNDWLYEVHRVGNIDKTRDAIKLLRWTAYVVGNDHIGTPRRVGIKGAMCQLDQPGEWYFDRTEKKLYIWPIQPINSQNPITILNDLRFFSGQNVEGITIRDITFQNFGELALYFKGSNNISVAGCTFRSSSGMGVRMMEGTNNNIISNNFYNMHQAFVMTGLKENRKKLIPEQNKANNNHIHDCTFKGYGLAAMLGVGCEFKNNLLHDVNGAFKFADANDMNIEYNEFYNVGYEMGDWNVIYSNDDYATRGNYIRHNFFHHMMEVPGTHGLAAVRQDGEATGYHVESNIMYKTGRAACQVMGADNSVSKNVVMETQYVWYSRQAPYEKTAKSKWEAKTAHLLQWKEKQDQLKEDIANGIKSVWDIENRTGQAEMVFGVEGWKTNEVWKNKYPNFEHTFDMMNPAKTPYTNSYTTVLDNYVDNGGRFPYHLHGNNTVTDMETVQLMLPSTSVIDFAERFTPSEMFEDIDRFDLRFKEDFTPVDNFEKWDFDSVGLYTDAYRRTTPDKSTYRNKIKEKYNGIRSSGGSFNGDVQNARYSEPDYLKLVHNISVLSSAPVHYFSLNESEGNIAKDQYQGIAAQWQKTEDSDLSWINGKFYNAASFTGADSSYFTFLSDTLSNAEGMTISLWLKPNASADSVGLVMTGENNSAWGLQLNGLTPVMISDGIAYNASSELNTEEWSHLVFTWSNEGEAKLYLNGNIVAENNETSSEFTHINAWNIGSLPDGRGCFPGNLDDIILFNKKLSNEEVKLIYLTGEQGISASTVVPIRVESMALNINRLILRDANSGSLSAHVSPANAADQNVIWTSTNPSIVKVDEDGVFTTTGFGEAAVYATTLDGEISDTCYFEVYEEVSEGLTAPLAYWPFDEINGDTAIDMLGDHHAVWQNSGQPQNWDKGLFTRSATFHGGADDRFVVDSDPLAGTDSFTISVWFNLDATAQYEGIITTRDLSTQHKTNNWGISAESNHVDARWDGKAMDSGDVIYSGSWYNVVYVWANDGTRKVYINGELSKSANDGSDTYVSNNIWFIGDDVCCNSREIYGRIDELKMYDKVLSDEEIKYMYELSKLGISYLDLSSKRPESVKIREESLLMKIGETTRLNALVLPADASNKVVEWSVMDESIATITGSGEVRTLQLGRTKIIAITSDAGLTDTINLEVIPNPVTSIQVLPESISLMEDKYATLTAQVHPSTATFKGYTWETTDPTVATVDDKGVIHSLLEGQAYVVATTENGGFKDSCMVTVKAIHVESVTLDKQTVEADVNEVFFLIASVLPENAKDKTITWSSSDPKVVLSVGNGIFSALSKGTVSIKAVAKDGGIADSCVVNVDGGVGMNDIMLEYGIKIFPSPANRTFTLELNNTDVKRISVCNVNGQVLKQRKTTESKLTIDIGDLSNGLYLVKIIFDDVEVALPLIKKQ